MGGLKAVVLGATGMIGELLVQQLSTDDRFESVNLLVRRSIPAIHPKITVTVVDFDDPTEPGKSLGHGDVIFCALGTTQAKVKGDKTAYRKVDFEIPLEAGKQGLLNGFSQYVLVSAVGADSGAGNFYTKLKGETENALKALAYPALHIFRPSLLMGDRKEFRFGEKVAQFVMPVFSIILQGGLKRFRPIKGSMVARAMIEAAAANRKGNHVYHYPDMQRLVN
ncbi:MAG: semialdehyde dehydrogenase [Chitinophagaceae bacterium]|nr:MAG: semialdehyde dehydrogenase [Chitinophagaceae bacterium]